MKKAAYSIVTLKLNIRCYNESSHIELPVPTIFTILTDVLPLILNQTVTADLKVSMKIPAKGLRF